MATPLILPFRVDDKASKPTDDLKKKLNQLGGQANKTEKNIFGLNSSLVKLGAGYLSVTSAFALGKDFIKVADSVTVMESRLNLATDSLQEFNTAQKQLFQISQESRTGLSANVDLFERLSRSTRDYNTTQAELFDLTETITKAMVISGGTAESMNASIIQLGQAFSANFQSVGQELGSIREQTPRLYQALLEGTGKTSKEFKKLAEDGKLSTQIIINALKSQAEAVDTEFTKIGTTVDQSMTKASNSMTTFVGQFDEATGLSETFSGILSDVSDVLDELTQKLEDYNALSASSLDTGESANKIAILGKQWTEYQDKIDEVLNTSYIPDWWANSYRQQQKFLEGQISLEVERAEILKLQGKVAEDTFKKIEKLNGGQKNKSSLLSVDTKTLGFQVSDAIKGMNQVDLFSGANYNELITTYDELLKASKDDAVATRETHEWFIKEQDKIFKNEIDELTRFSKEFGDYASSAIASSIAGVLNNFAQGKETSTSDIATSLGAGAVNFGTMALATGGNPYGGMAIAGGLALQAISSQGFLGGDKTYQDKIADQQNKVTELATNSLSDFTKALEKSTNTLESYGSIGSSVNTQFSELTKEISNTENDISQLNLILATARNREDGSFTQEELSILRSGKAFGVYGNARDIVNTAIPAIQEYNNNLSNLTNAFSQLVEDTLSSSLDFTRFSTSELQSITSGFNESDYENTLDSINNIALSVKQAGGSITEAQKKELIDLYSLPNFIKGQDYKEAIDEYKSRMEEITEAIKSAGESINDTIDSIKGTLSSASVTQIQDYAQTLSVIGYKSSLGLDTSGYIGDLTSMAQNISSTAFGDTELIRQNLINSLEQAKLDIGFEDEVIDVRIIEDNTSDTIVSSPTVTVSNPTASSDERLANLEYLMSELVATLKAQKKIIDKFDSEGIKIDEDN